MLIMEGIQAPTQVRKIPGQTHPFEIGIEGPFGDGFIGKGIQDSSGTFPPEPDQ